MTLLLDRTATMNINCMKTKEMIFLSPTQAAASTLADIKPKRGAGDQLQITRRNH